MKINQRRTIIAGNWKSFKDKDRALDLVEKLVENSDSFFPEVVIAPPPMLLELIINHVGSTIKVASQNCHGSGQANMLKKLGISYCIIGHSDYRQDGETNDMIRDKVDLLLNNDITPILCCGENRYDREKGHEHDVITDQLDNLDNYLSHMVIAYEPVWAIGGNTTASLRQIQDMHAHIRKILSYNNVPILYGGSCNPINATEIFSDPNVDGGLIGRASLIPDQFNKLIDIAKLAKF